MITLKFIRHKNPEFTGVWNWNKNIISIGDTIGSFEVINNDLMFYPSQSLPYFLQNGKRAKSSKKIILGDILSFDDIEVQVTAFTFIPEIDRVDLLKVKFQEMKNNNPELFSLLAKLEKNP